MACRGSEWMREMSFVFGWELPRVGSKAHRCILLTQSNMMLSRGQTLPVNTVFLDICSLQDGGYLRWQPYCTLGTTFNSKPNYDLVKPVLCRPICHPLCSWCVLNKLARTLTLRKNKRHVSRRDTCFDSFFFVVSYSQGILQYARNKDRAA